MPGDYALFYPQKLLQQIVDEFFDFYQNADLVSYPELVQIKANSIAELLNNAWHSAQTNPLEYFTFEIESINCLRFGFGLSKI